MAALVTMAVLLGAAGVHASESAAGEPVSGLQVTVTAANPQWPLGTEMAFEATLTNVSERTFLLDLFGNLDEIYKGKRGQGHLVSCWQLAWGEHAPGPPGPRRGEYTLSREQFLRLEPGQSHTQPLALTLSEVPPGSYRIRLTYVPRAASASFSLPDRWEEQQQFKDPMWIGMAYSNELTIEVVATSPPALQTSTP